MRTQHALFAAASLILILTSVLVRPITGGDASEYLHMTHGWINHWSPDLRPGDGNSAEPILRAMGYTDHVFGRGYYGADNGRLFSAHFWLYSLSMVPATLFMRLINGNEFAAFQSRTCSSSWPRLLSLFGTEMETGSYFWVFPF
jgi:hypothetical protein